MILLPRFSLKVMLVLTTVLAFCFLAFRQAILGQYWAQAVVTMLGCCVALFALFAILFAIAYFFSIVGRERIATRVESPFAQDRLPPQVIPPRDVE